MFSLVSCDKQKTALVRFSYCIKLEFQGYVTLLPSQAENPGQWWCTSGSGLRLHRQNCPLKILYRKWPYIDFVSDRCKSYIGSLSI
jgi:hypothetical protein